VNTDGEEEEGEGERGRTTLRGSGLAEDDGVLSVVAMASCGGAGVRGRNGGRYGGSVGCLWWRKKEKDAEEENLQRGEGRPRGGCAYRR